MEITLVNLRYRADLGGFDAAELEGAAAQRSRRASAGEVSVREHLYEVGGVPHLCFVLVRGATAGAAARANGAEAPVEERDRALYERLRAWRRAKAISGGVPPYRVLTNRQLAAVVATRPASTDELAAIEGIGRATVEHHGAEILAQLGDPQPAASLGGG